MRIGIAQIGSIVGDIPGNRDRILRAARSLREQAPSLVVFPELAICGYPPRDLLFEAGFVDACEEALFSIAERTFGGPPLLLGAPLFRRGGTRGREAASGAGREKRGPAGLVNAAVLIQDGTFRVVAEKQLLPVYDVFNEARWFVPGRAGELFAVSGRSIGALICEDLWDEGYDTSPGKALEAQGAELIVCISASPYRRAIHRKREEQTARRKTPVVFVNRVGADDELIFDGGSFVWTGKDVALVAPKFEEALAVFDVDAPVRTSNVSASDNRDVFAALTLGVREFCGKNRVGHAVVGLSGGIDSALVACIAKEALGATRVTAVALPSRHTDPRSTDVARELAEILGIGFVVHPIEPIHRASLNDLVSLVGQSEGSRIDENLQARLRMVFLMALVNAKGGVLLNTSNKTELTLGYGTLYGDLAGTLSVIGDLTKPEVVEILRAYDDRLIGKHVPSFIFDRPPSAELLPGQVDPFDYPRIAPLVDSWLNSRGPSSSEIHSEEVDSLRRSFRANEYKRWQAGIILKVSETSFGSGRMVPVTHRWR